MPIMTEYCCRIILDNMWEDTAKVLDGIIKNSAYEEGVIYIESLDVDDNKKRRLIKCLLSYKESC